MYILFWVAQHVAFCSQLKYPDATRQREHEYYVEAVHDTRSHRDKKICEIYGERGKGLGREWPATAREEVRWV